MHFSSISLAVSTATGVVSATSFGYEKRASNSTLQWFGVNESGAEFGNTAIPGQLGKDYTWPNNSAIDILIAKGMNIFRIPILMERIVPPPSMTGAINNTYLSGLSDTINHITSAGAFAVIDSQNFGRYNGAIFTSASDFQTYWTNLATVYANNSKVIFDCNNEFHDEPSNTLVVNLNQACIDGVRAAGANTQFIFVEGTSFTGAWTWISSGNAAVMGNLTDPSDKIIYEMHQYLDIDGSGTSAVCVNSTIGAERVADATTWLRENKKLGILGEFAGGNNSVCETAVTGMLDSLTANSDVWMGAMWWGGGPFWGDYIFSMEPPSGNGFVAYIDILVRYVPVVASSSETENLLTLDKANSTQNGNSSLASPTVAAEPIQSTSGVSSVSVQDMHLATLITFAALFAIMM